jgi:hypothetical protein
MIQSSPINGNDKHGEAWRALFFEKIQDLGNTDSRVIFVNHPKSLSNAGAISDQQSR